jgi:hypothetical protein
MCLKIYVPSHKFLGHKTYIYVYINQTSFWVIKNLMIFFNLQMGYSQVIKGIFPQKSC